MKNPKKVVVDELVVDVLEYAFVEWLIRRGIFAAFRMNYDRTSPTKLTFRECLRAHIRHAYFTPCLGPEALISSAFLFPSTPEGYEFWVEHSDAWSSFYNKL